MREKMNKVNIMIVLTIMMLISNIMKSNSEGDLGKIRVATSLGILKSIVKRIGGDRVEVFSILPSNVEPHQFTLTPQIINQVLNVDLIIIDGHMEWEYKLIEQLAMHKDVNLENVVINLIEYKDNMTILDIPQEMGLSGKNYHGYWILPENIMVIAEVICGKLSQIDPEGKSYYHENLKNLLEDASKIKGLIEELKAKISGKNVVLGFLSEQYIAYLFNLKITAILSLEEGVPTKPGSINRAYNALQSGGLIIISDISSKMPVYNAIIEISKETGSPIIEVIMMRDMDYTLMMTYNIGKIDGVLSITIIRDQQSEYGLNTITITVIGMLAVVSTIEFLQIYKFRRKIYGYSKS
ncbi:MAG: metal ABC transporter substrate-binding protein [Candidatus Methanomethylicia archaeon]